MFMIGDMKLAIIALAACLCLSVEAKRKLNIYIDFLYSTFITYMYIAYIVTECSRKC